MKKKLSILLLSSLALVSCNKNDDPEPDPIDASAPSLVLKGKTKDTVSLNSTYSDPGATASDDTDGDISGAVVVSGNLNTDLAGDYTRKYNVTDAAGNKAAEVTRMIHVRNDADFLDGSYAVVTNCGATGSTSYNSTISSSTTQNRKISISSISNNLTGQPVTATVNGTLLIDPLSGNGSTFSGSGSFSNNNKTISIGGYLSQGGMGYVCTSVFTKQ